MTNSKNRNKCVICENKKIKTIFKLKKMPVFMGTNRTQNTIYNDMTFEECEICKNVQIKEIIDPNLLYMDNHNTEIIGETWTEHYEEFITFINPIIKNKSVLEIGDPSCKISKILSKETKKWDIVEINPNLKITKPINVNFIKSYFDEEFKIDYSPEIIIHSHLLEHIPNPINHLNHVHKLLVDDGHLIFSIPNLGKILKNGFSPNSALHFEHTYFFDMSFMSKILNHCGFDVLSVYEYKNHSLFFKCKKINYKKMSTLSHEFSISEIFLTNYKNYLKKIEVINHEIKNHNEVYLYGCHISSQFLINIGLNLDNIKYILDNSESKQENKLYGTDLICKSPNIISNIKTPVVIVSHMGVYSDEISKQLKKINKKILLL
jgi:2-polyprenyl-3-methyl-5-hydroxy-6-metoxy-1,4-benzoquinol methylase